MNYYEELGIKADAEAEDIRKAHRRLVKLMHPDQQLDAHMKLLAETQMRRLNTIVATLLNPNQRGEYDEALRGRHVARPVSVKEWRGVPWWLVSSAAASVVAVTGIWFFADHLGSSFAKPLSIPPQETASVSRPSPVAAGPANTASVSVRVVTPAEHAAPDAAAIQPTNSTKAGAPVRSGDVPAAPALPTRALARLQPLERASTSRAIPDLPAAGFPFEGDWVYVPKEPEERKAGFYPPQFIEFKLSQQHQGGLQGQYSARYEVSGMNNPVSPEVSFQVASAGPALGKFVWHSSNGSRGILAVHAVDGGTIRIEWRTSVASGPPAFRSGIATLVRRR